MADTRRPRKKISDKVRWQVMRRDGFRCRYCGLEAADADRPLVLDHWYPHSAGGSDDPSNLITACHACNQGKNAIKITDDLVPDVGGLKPIAVQRFLNELAYELRGLGLSVGVAGRIAHRATECGLWSGSFIRTWGLLMEIDSIPVADADSDLEPEPMPWPHAEELLDMFRPEGL